jgi:molybdopterin synthase sulfur carrier subunit
VHVTVRLGSGLATAAGTRRLNVDLPPDASVATLLSRLREVEPAMAPALGSAVPVVHGTHVTAAHALRDGDEVALLIPVAGGAPDPHSPERRHPWP